MNRNFTTYSDDELLEMLKDGKAEAEGAFREIYNRYASKIHAYCVGMVHIREQAEDFFQETFIRFFNSIHEMSANNIPGYLMTIARNLCLNYLRLKKETVSIDDLEFMVQTSDSYEKTELFNILMSSLELLDDKYKEAFILREFEGLSYKDIAEVTKTSLTNAKSRVARARDRLIEVLEPYINDWLRS